MKEKIIKASYDPNKPHVSKGKEGVRLIINGLDCITEEQKKAFKDAWNKPNSSSPVDFTDVIVTGTGGAMSRKEMHLMYKDNMSEEQNEALKKCWSEPHSFVFNGADDTITYSEMNDDVFFPLTNALLKYTKEPTGNKFIIKCNDLLINDIVNWFREVMNVFIGDSDDVADTMEFDFKGNTFTLEHHKILEDNPLAYGVIEFNGKYIEIKRNAQEDKCVYEQLNGEE